MIRISGVDYMCLWCVEVQQVYTKCVYFSVLTDQFTCLKGHLIAIKKNKS